MQEYLTTEEVAAQLRVTPKAVRDWCRAGRLQAVRAGKLWRIKPADLETFLRKHTEVQEQGPKFDGLAALTY